MDEYLTDFLDTVDAMNTGQQKQLRYPCICTTRHTKYETELFQQLYTKSAEYLSAHPEAYIASENEDLPRVVNVYVDELFSGTTIWCNELLNLLVTYRFRDYEYRKSPDEVYPVDPNFLTKYSLYFDLDLKGNMDESINESINESMTESMTEE